jgi:ketosteroid isomerase-like protein
MKTIAFAMLLHALSPANSAPADVAEAQLRAINHRLVSAHVQLDADFVAALVDQDFRKLAANGERVDRAAHLAAFGKIRAPLGASVDQVVVRQYGEAALVQGVYEAPAEGQVRRVRYTDVYLWKDGRWRMVAAQATPLRGGAGKLLLRGTAPVHAPWQGTEPSGSDDAVLRQLNADYVQAYRDADVAWYDAHLAPDYTVVNGDGSYSDRAAALSDFAKPSYATLMRRFPVDHVVIRRFGDLALIEAENAFERKDGRTGVSRYTDIWHRRDGRWLCVSAHITPFRLP